MEKRKSHQVSPDMVSRKQWSLGHSISFERERERESGGRPGKQDSRGEGASKGKSTLRPSMRELQVRRELTVYTLACRSSQRESRQALSLSGSPPGDRRPAITCPSCICEKMHSPFLLSCFLLLDKAHALIRFKVHLPFTITPLFPFSCSSSS